MHMRQEQWERVRELFHHAFDLPQPERAAYLNSNCADVGVRAEVEALLEKADTRILESPAVDLLREAMKRRPARHHGLDSYRVFRAACAGAEGNS